MKFDEAKNAYGNSVPPQLTELARRATPRSGGSAPLDLGKVTDNVKRALANPQLREQLKAAQARRGEFAVTDLSKVNEAMGAAAKVGSPKPAKRVEGELRSAMFAAKRAERIAKASVQKRTPPDRIVKAARKAAAARPNEAIKLAAGMKRLAAGSTPTPGEAERVERTAAHARAKEKGQQVKFREEWRPPQSKKKRK